MGRKESAELLYHWSCSPLELSPLGPKPSLDPTDGTPFYLRGINHHLLWFNHHLVGLLIADLAG